MKFVINHLQSLALKLEEEAVRFDQRAAGMKEANIEIVKRKIAAVSQDKWNKVDEVLLSIKILQNN